MANIVINKKTDLKFDLQKGNKWREVHGNTAKRMIECRKVFDYDRAGVVKCNNEVYDSKELTFYKLYGRSDNLMGLMAACSTEIREVPFRLFSIGSGEAYDHVVNMLIKNKGYLDGEEQPVMHGIWSAGGSELDAKFPLIYSIENLVYGERRHLYNVLAKSNFSLEEARKDLERDQTYAQLIDKGQMFDLLRTIAKDYGLYNIELKFFNSNGSKLGSCNSMSFPAHMFPDSIEIHMAENAPYKHILIHEMAHAIEITRYRHTGHSDMYINILVQLTERYHENGKEIANRMLSIFKSATREKHVG